MVLWCRHIEPCSNKQVRFTVNSHFVIIIGKIVVLRKITNFHHAVFPYKNSSHYSQQWMVSKKRKKNYYWTNHYHNISWMSKSYTPKIKWKIIANFKILKSAFCNSYWVQLKLNKLNGHNINLEIVIIWRTIKYLS